MKTNYKYRAKREDSKHLSVKLDNDVVYNNLTDRAKMFVSPEAVEEVLDSIHRIINGRGRQ